MGPAELEERVDDPAVADGAVVDAFIDGEIARHAGCFEARGQGMAVVEQRVEAADDQMRWRRARKVAEKRPRAPIALLLRPLKIGLPQQRARIWWPHVDLDLFVAIDRMTSADIGLGFCTFAPISSRRRA